MHDRTEQTTTAVMHHPSWCTYTETRDDGQPHPMSDEEHHGRELHVNGPSFDYEVTVALGQTYELVQGAQVPAAVQVAVTTFDHGNVSDPCTAHLSLDGARQLIEALQRVVSAAERALAG